MRLIRLILLFLITVICLLGSVNASVNLQMDFYNSDDTLSIGLTGENMNFDAATILMPDSLLYNNGGTSISPQAYYSYEVTLNGETLSSGAKTNSGAFGWSTMADSNYKGDGSRQFVHTQKSMVKNGNLETYYANPGHQVEQTIHTDNAVYSQKGMATPDLMAASGAGATIGNSENNKGTSDNSQSGDLTSNAASENSHSDDSESENTQHDSAISEGIPVNNPSDENDQLNSAPVQNAQSNNAAEGSDNTNNNHDDQNEESHKTKSVQGVMSVIGPEKSASIEIDVNGDTDAQWRSMFKSSQSEYAVSQAIVGVMRDSTMNKLQMKGEATGFPTQLLPPGDVNVTYKYDDTNTKELLQRLNDEIGDFKEKYPQPQTPVLMYYFDEKAYVNPIADDNSSHPVDPAEFYKMSIQFKVK